MKYKLKKTSLGYQEISNKPTQKQLDAYYKNEYYQKPFGTYQIDYTEDQLEFFKNKAKLCLETLITYNRKPRTLLDLGCGEGFFANYFYENKITVSLNDLTSTGIKKFHPHLEDFLNVGDSYKEICKLVKKNEKFDFICLNNVLEHVINPDEIVESIKSIMQKDSVLRITVPNDFSEFQEMLVTRSLTSETWVSPPDHLTYFNSHNLISFFEKKNFKVLSVQTDFPIEQYLTNPNANYWKDRSLGKGADISRVICTNYLASKDLHAYMKYCELGAKLQFGRNTIIYVAL